MKKIIFVNATSCTSGGVLSILNQFVDSINKYDVNNKYYIFTTIDLKIESCNIFVITEIKGKSYKDRLIWDLYGMKKWANKNNINPNLIISLQNTGVRFNDVKQIIYLHQCLPYSEESKWSILKSDERKLWFYKNIFKIWIEVSIGKRNYIVVQNNWLKNKLIKRGFLPSNIVVSTPDINSIDLVDVKGCLNNRIELFYPAADYKYKNHEIILKAIKILSKNEEFLRKVDFIFTISKDSEIYKSARNLGVDKYIKFIGNIKYEDVLIRYKNCTALLFPSYIETVGLPLIECANFGKKILVADCDYSRETLGEYENSKFINYKNEVLWAKEIEKCVEKYELKPLNIKKSNSWEDVFNIYC